MRLGQYAQLTVISIATVVTRVQVDRGYAAKLFWLAVGQQTLEPTHLPYHISSGVLDLPLGMRPELSDLTGTK